MEFSLAAQTSQSVLHCLVPGCGKSQAEHPNKVFFMLPTDDEKLHHWLLVCRRSDLINNFKDMYKEQYGICEDHFIEDNFLDDSKQALKFEAIPTMFNDDVKQASFLSGQKDEQAECEVFIKEELPDMSDDLFFDENSLEELDNFSQLCRLCASRIREVVYIFNSSGQEQQIAKKINTCLPVTVRKTDPLPKQLCMSCFSKLNMCYEFAELCLQAEDKLLTLSRQNSFRSNIISSQNSEQFCNDNLGSIFYGKSFVDVKIKNIQNNALDSEENSKLDIDSELTQDHKYCCPLCVKGIMTVEENDFMESELHHQFMCENSANDPTGLSECGVENRNYVESVMCQNNTNDNNTSDKHLESKEDIGSQPLSSTPSNFEGNNESFSCRICGELFENVESCIAHAAIHFQSDFFPCSICDLCFSSQSSFKNHCEKQHHDHVKTKVRSTKRLTCNLCGKRFNTERTLGGHACGSSPRPFKCDTCGKSFLTEVRLAFHQQVHQGGSAITCEYCGKIFTRENNLYDHVRLVHMGEKAHCCDQCGKTFQLKARLIAHQRVHTGERPFECDICGGKFYDKATLKGHHITHMNVKPFQCEKCGRCFARKTLFKQHALAHLSEDHKRSRTYSCKICGGSVVFSSYAKLIEHRKEVHPDSEMNEVDDNSQVSKPFKCEECGKSFAYRVTLVAHQRNHTGELPFQCEYCSKRFSQKRSLILHRRTHTGEKPFVCLECGKRFVQSAHLYSHTRLHTGEKPYSCEVCGDSFRLKDVRDAHQRKHTGERPFKCNVCEKAFRTSHSYYQHMWIHQGKKPYPCSYCGKAFRRSNGLKIHIRIHTGEKPHSCDICGRSFAQKQDMKKHRNLHMVGKL